MTANPEEAVALEVSMRRLTLSGIPAARSLVAPLTIRRAGFNDAVGLATLFARAYEPESWDADSVEREVLGDASVRGTLVIDASGRVVATVSFQVRPETPESGWVRWVATDPDWRRKGLARSLLIRVLELAAGAGCVDARLHTRTDRLAAISLYRQLGFERVS